MKIWTPKLIEVGTDKMSLSLLFFGLHLCLTPAAVASDSIMLNLKDSVELTRSEVYLEDVASCPDDDGICDELSGVRILESVSPGSRLRISGEQIISILAAEFPQKAFTLVGAQSVEIQAAEYRISQSEIETQISSRLEALNGQWKTLRLSLKRLKIFERIVARSIDYQLVIPVLDSDVDNSLLSIADGVGGWLSLNASVIDKDWRQDVKLNMQIAVESQVPVAKYDLEAGKILSAEDLELAWKKVRRLNDFSQTSKDHLVGKELRRKVSRDEIVDPRHIKKSVAIARGHAVKLKLSSGGISLTSEAKAMQAGSIGDEIEVQVVATKKKLLAKVIDSETVEGKF
jgi:flagella basal body P-ring formation protein FlgA